MSQAERLRELIERSQQLDQRIVRLQAVISDLLRRVDASGGINETAAGTIRRPRLASKRTVPSVA